MAQLKDTIITGDLRVTGRIYTIDAEDITKGILPVPRGGTGQSSFTSGQALIGNGTGALSTRAITNNTSASDVTSNTNLITANTLNNWKGTTNVVKLGTVTTGTWNATVVAVKYGGTGRSTLTSNAILAGAGENAVGMITTANGALYATSANGAASFGTLPVGQGGTGQTSFTSGAALIGNGTGGISTRAITNITTAGDITSNTNLITANTLNYWQGTSNISKLGTIGTGTWKGSIITVPYGGTGKDTLTSNAVITGNGTNAVNTVSTAPGAFYATQNGGAAIFGTLPVAQGGTGQTSFTSDYLLVGNDSSALKVIQKTNANTANTVVQRDGSGNFSAGTITASLSGNATTCTYPLGFASRTTGAGWGNTTGTSFTSWNDASGGSIDFRKDNPSSGKMSVKVDGRFYFNEGNTPAAGLKSVNGYWGMTGPDGEDNCWIRTTSLGILPYQSGGAGSGHNSIGTSSWYFSTAYIDNIYGNLKGNADSATALTSNAGSATIPVYFSGGKPVAITTGTAIYTKSITVTGDKDTYYPVVISATADKTKPHIISIWKNLGSVTNADYPGNHSNKTSSMWLMYEYRNVYWDGNGGYYKTWYYSMPYATLVAKTQALGSGVGNLCLWLRGGTTAYNISSDYDFSVTAYYEDTNIGSSSYPVNVAPTTTVTTKGWQLISTLGYGNIEGNAATATKLSNTPNNTTTFLRGDNSWSNSLTGNLNAASFTLNGATSAGNQYITGSAGRIFFGGNFHIDSLGSNKTYINYYTANDVYMVSGSSQGKVGIGTNSPSYKLHVVGDIYANDGWLRTNGARGWYNDSYSGGWYMTDANWIRNYNSKPVLLEIGTHNGWGIGGHRLALAMTGSSHVSMLLNTGSVGYGFCVNNDGNWYFGKRTNGNLTSTSGDSYLLYGSNTHLSPYADMGINLGIVKSREFNNTFTRTVNARHLDASGVYSSDMNLYIGYGVATPTQNTYLYYSTGTHGAGATSRTLTATVNSSGFKVENYLGIKGQNTSYNLYVNGSSRFNDTLYFYNTTGNTNLSIESRQSKNNDNAEIETITGLVTKSTSFLEIRGFAPPALERTTYDRPAPYGLGFGNGSESAGIMPIGAGDKLQELRFYGANSGPTIFTFGRQIWEGSNQDSRTSNKYATYLSINSTNGNLSTSGTITSSSTITGSTFSGSGASLTNLNGSNISSGTVAFARLPELWWANVKVASGTNSDTAPTFNNITLTRTSDQGLSVGTIRGRAYGSQTGNYIHMYERVHIGSPSGWGSRNAPSYGLSTYGGAWLATDTGTVGIGTTSPSRKLHVAGSIYFTESTQRTSRHYPYVTSSEKSSWYKITLPFYNAETTSSAKWFMNSFDLNFGGGYNSNPSGIIHVVFYWYRAKENGAWSLSQQSAYGSGILMDKIALYYSSSEPGILYVNNTANTYNGISMQNLYVDDTAPSLDWTTTKIETCSAITVANYTKINIATVTNQNDANLYYYSNNAKLAQIKDGCLSLFPNNNNWREGLRIHSYGSWADITLCGNDNTGDTGTSANSWFVGNNNGNFYISRNGSDSSGSAILSCVGNIWSIKGTEIKIPSNNLWIQGGSNAGSNSNRMTLTSGMPTGLQYNSSQRGTRIFANAIAFADPYNGNSNNDSGWIRHIEETGNSGTLEIAVGDDGNELIKVRQYNTSSNIAAELTLLDGSHNSIMRNINPVATATYTLGTSSLRWNYLYSNKINSVSTASSWLDGQRYERGGYNLADATDTGSYWPWMRQTNTGSGKWFSFGILNKSFYWIGSATSRTENSYDRGMVFNVENGQLTVDQVNGALNGNASTATKLSNTPNNTTTFLRGDNTWTSTINAMMVINAWPGLEVVNPNKNSGETGIRVRTTDSSGNNIIKGYFGWLSSQGTYLYNANSAKYLGIKDDGTPHYHGNTLLHAGNYNTYAAAKSHTHPVSDLTWGGGVNLKPTATANNQEWSIDLSPGDYTGTYWHVWSTPKSATILACYTDDRHVTMPGNLESTSTTTGTLRVTGGIGATGQVTAARVGVNGSNTNYSLYVNGTSYLGDNTTLNKTIYFGNNTSSGKAILAYSSSYPNYGIWYFDENVDVLTFSASNNANSKTGADLSINGQGDGTLSTRNRRIPHTNNTTGTVGTNQKPVYVNAGTITQCNDTLAVSISGNANTADNAKNTQSNYGAKSFIVDGDANTYYPVLISGFTSNGAATLLNISRGYSEQAPDTWYTNTHKGGLTLTILSNGDSAWGGNHALGLTRLNSIINLSEQYCTMVGDIQDTNFGLVIWLRGGTAKYWVTSNGGQSITATPYLEEHTQSSNTVAPITVVNTNRINSYRFENNFKFFAANISTNTNGITYYTNTTGTFGNIRSASGAFYSTGQDVKPTFGTLPVAQGGTGQTSIANIQAGKDGSGNTITSSYMKWYSGSSAPSDISGQTVWKDTSVSPFVLKVYTSGAWRAINTYQ